MATRRRDLQCTFGSLLPLYLTQVGTVLALIGHASLGRRQQRLSLEVIEQAQQVGCCNHFDLPRPCGFRTLHCRAYQPAPDFGRMKCREQNAG